MKISPLFHEQEVFDIVLPRVMSWNETSKTFHGLGFRLTDDFVEKMRGDAHLEVWQSEAIATVDFKRADQSVYPDEDDFDSLFYSIFPCTLPEACVRESITLLFDLAAALEGVVQRKGQAVSLHESLAMVVQWGRDLLEETGDVMGSESARILLEMKYQK